MINYLIFSLDFMVLVNYFVTFKDIWMLICYVFSCVLCRKRAAYLAEKKVIDCCWFEKDCSWFEVIE